MSATLLNVSAEERERIAALRRLLVLDTEPEPMFDNIVRMAAAICEQPIALLSLVDEDRQWFKVSIGLPDTSQTGRSISFCAQTVQGNDVFEVPDASADPRFATNPLVLGPPHIRFYAGAPLALPGGERVGSLCVIGRAPQQLDTLQRQRLRSLAAIAGAALEMRRELIQKSITARSDYEQSLKMSEAHYRAVVEDQAELISLATPEGQLTYVNPAYARHFGHTPATMVGTSLFDFIEPEHRAGVRALFDQVSRTGETVFSENGMMAADGTRHWVAWTNGVSRSADGQLVIHSVGRDITARRAAEEALRKSQSFLYRTGRAAGVGGWEFDLRTQQLTWSEETRRIHEVPPDYEPTLEAAIDFYSNEARDTLRQAIAQGIATGKNWDLELPLTTATGRHIWVRAVGEAEYEADQPVRLIGAFQDISSRKQLEHDMAAQATTTRLIAESIPAAVATVNCEGRYTYVNSAFASQCGRRREEIIGRTAREVLGEAEFEQRWPSIQQALAGQSVTVEIARQDKDTKKYVSLSYFPLRVGADAIDGLVVVSQDVTQVRLEALRLAELSQRDPLTGVLNRKGFEHFLERQLLAGGGASVGLLYIDLDDFKPVNDRHGHPAGDRVLIAFGQRLTALVRETDAVARLGGDEFALVLTRLNDPSKAATIADKVLAAAREPFDIGTTSVSINASVGLACGVVDDGGSDELILRADNNLLKAKAAGKGKWVSDAGAWA